MLRGRQLVNLHSDVPGHPAPPPTSVDAIVCTPPPSPNCTKIVPPGWTIQTRTFVTLALPPAS
jgi:hypothetical protein